MQNKYFMIWLQRAGYHYYKINCDVGLQSDRQPEKNSPYNGMAKI